MPSSIPTAPRSPAAHRSLHLAASDTAALGEVAIRAAAALLVDEALAGVLGQGPARAAVVGDAGTRRAALVALAEGREHPALVTGELLEPAPKVGFLISGEGGERALAGAALVAEDPGVRETVARSLGAVGRPDLADLRAELSGWRDRRDSKLLLGALDLGLAGWLAARGVRPAAVLGHSVGEYVAAALAGVVSGEDALRLLDDLGQVLAGWPEEGGLALVRAPREAVEAALDGVDGAWVAVDNAPDWVGVSGSRVGLKAARAALARRGLHSRGLRVEQPVHGPALAPLAPAIHEAARRVPHQAPDLPWVSSVTGGRVTAVEPGYWADALVAPVRFREAWAAARGLDVQLWVDLGPRPGLALFAGEDAPVLSALDPRLDDRVALARLLGWLWCHGAREEEATEGAVPLPPLAAARAAVEAGLGRPLRPKAPLPPPPPDREGALRLAGEALGAVLGRAVGPGDAEVGLFDLGLDSLGALALAAALQERSGQRWTVMDVFSAGSLRGLARRLGGEAPAPRAPAPPPRRAPVAIVGAGLRLPGGVRDLDGLWALLAAGRETVALAPPGRWPDVAPGVPTRGSFLDDVAGFEPGFFGISPREAPHLDPTQRLLLEVAWEALEDAGLDPHTLRDHPTGVYVGTGPSDYAGSPRRRDPSQVEAWSGPGTEPSVAAGRISYVLGLRGPTLVVDTACSSSLVALATAVRALQDGDCALALAGGASLLLSPVSSVWLSRAGALSPDGRCKAFSAQADGFGRGEGASLVVLKRLSDAVQDGDRVLGVIQGVAVNHDGASGGLTVPNPEAQQALLAQALDDAGLVPDDLDQVECHGTGTPLGDPIEVSALAFVHRGRNPDRPLWIGSLKSNLGHLEWAAGIAGLLKVLASLRYQALPPSLYSQPPNPHLDWEALPVRVVDRLRPWAPGARPRRAGVSSFGISGTNAHVVVEEAPDVDLGVDSGVDLSPIPVVVSGRTEAGLRAQAGAWAEWLSAHPEAPLGSVARTAALRRTCWSHRAVVVASGTLEAAAGLQALAEGAAHPGVVTGAAASEGRRVFVFPGQGGQWAGMGRALLAESPAFAAVIAACDAALRPHTGWSVQAVLAGEEGAPSLERVDVVQPALWAMSVGLAALWRSFGVEPDLVVGHSQGEIAAAVVAGILSVEDGARVVALRSRLVRRLAGTGAMASVELPLDAVQARLAGRGADLSVAVVNGPGSTGVAGVPEAVDALLSELASEGVGGRRIAVDYASHSPQVDALLPELMAALHGIQPRPGQLPMVSTVTGARVEGEALDAAWWCRNLREPVRFDRALTTLVAEGARSFVELSPHPVLTVPVMAAVEEEGGVAFGSLRREEGGLGRLLRSLGEAVVAGARPDWRALLGTGPWADLPTTAFVREHHWLDEAKRVAGARDLGLEEAEHPLLSAVTEVSGGLVVLSGRLSLSETPWIGDHRVFGRAVLPGTGLLELALAAARRCWPEAVAPSVVELIIAAPLVLPETGALSMQVVVEAEDAEGHRAFRVASRPAEDEGGDWTEHATGVIASQGEAVAPPLPSWPPAGATALDGLDLYPRLSGLGLGYGPSFQGLSRAWRDRDGSVWAEVALPEAAGTTQGYGLHPALLDTAQHGLFLVSDPGEAVRLPFALADVTLHATGARALRVRLSGGGAHPASLTAWDAAGAPVLRIGALDLRPATAMDLARGPDTARHLYRVAWEVVPAEPASLAGAWAVLGDLDGALVAALRHAGVPVQAFASWEDLLSVSSPVAGVLVDWGAPAATEVASPAHALAAAGLAQLQSWLQRPTLAQAALVWLTRGAVATRDGEPVPAPAARALWGLARATRAEHPDRALRLLDVGEDAAATLLPALGCLAEPELALRAGQLLAPRLRPAGPAALALPASGPWHLAVARAGSFDGLAIQARPAAAAPLGPGEVRLSVRAAGLNFRDVLAALGEFPGEPGPMGHEAAGVVLEVGSQVQALRPGDRVFGLVPAAFGPLAVADARLLAPIPGTLSFVEAAALPVALLTAWFGLFDLGGLRAGQRVLIHAAAGGVGQAALQLARLAGAEVYGTASPGKWPVLRALGLDETHLATSRDASFAPRILAATGGAGVDVVLDSLTGPLVDASLGLLVGGGRFIEMGKADIRDAAEVARAHPGVVYRAFDLVEAGPERLGALLRQVAELIEEGKLSPLPVVAHDLRQAPAVFRALAQGRTVGKRVLVPPRAPAAGTAVVTGGTSGLGARAAAHLVARHGVKHLLLLSRQGPDAPGVAGLVASLQEAGAETVEVVAADAGERAALEAAFARLPAERPVSVVVHAAGVLADGVVTALTEDQLHRVLRPKVDGAVHLAALLAARPDVPLVLYSSAAGTLGNAGQANYAAANATLDALAEARSAQGLPTLSLAWGLWEEGGLVAHLTGADHARLRRQGARPLPVAEGLALLDAALARGGAGFVLLHLERRALGDEAPPLLQGLAPRGLRVAGTTPAPGGLAGELAALPEAERRARLLALVGQEVALVLGLPGPAAVAADRPLRELGLDSLMAVELRNRLGARAQLTLPATLAFDHPTPQAIATLLLRQALPEGAPRLPVVAATQHDPDAPIAIVGMACRTPGGVVDPEGYWALLSEGRDAIGPFPSRWDTAALYDPDPDAVGKSVAREGGFLDDLAGFEPGFFGISPREALAMDPGQRLMLEVAWEALERAGIAPGALGESATGVYLGSMGSDYGRGSDELELLDGYRGTGTASSVLAGRVAYTLGLQGPAMTVDTACSSSLVALHLAAGALRQGECDRALAGGVTVMCTPALFVEFSRLRGLSPDGRCKSFSAEADGAGWSEGVGLLVLKRLSDARRDGDRVLGVLRGSAVNQDGRSQGLTAPNGPSQQRAIRRALEQSGLLPDDLDAVEAHGTGTKLGDPIEAGALSAVFGPMRPPDRPLWLGSSKSNLGHTQAAAGVLGVMKVVLALQHEVLPATLHARNPSPHVDWERSGLQLAQEARPWPRRAGRPRRAGVSSFGVSGTNAHVIVEEAPDVPLGLEEEVGRSTVPVVVSGRTEAGLRAQARAWAAWLSTHPETPLGSVARTAALRRSAWRHRAVVVARDAAEAAAGLQALSEGGEVRTLAGEPGTLVGLFTGQGSQRPGMGRALAERWPAFRDALDLVVSALDRHLPRPLREVMWAEEGSEAAARLDQTAWAQPALFALEVALFRALATLGVHPEVLVGHSLGELAAACCAGLWSLDDAARLVVARGRLMGALPQGGAMAAIAATEDELGPVLSALGGRVALAAVNGPRAVVVSGEAEAIDAVCRTFADRRPSRLSVSHAFHSGAMAPMLDAFAEVARSVRYQTPSLPLVSGETGRLASAAELCDPATWVRQVRRPVRFGPALATAVALGGGGLLELGPAGVLCALAAEGAGEALPRIPALRARQPEPQALAGALGALWTAGYKVDWSALLGTGPWADLPTTAFVREYHWLEEAKVSADLGSAGLSEAGHPLLSAVTEVVGGLLVLSGRLSLRDTPWLTDHRVFGRAVLPGTALLELALAAARRCWPEATAPTVSELVLAAPVVLPETGARSVQVVVEAEDGEGRRSVRVASRPAEDEGGDWTEHASGTIAAQGEEVAPRLPSWPPVGATALDGSDLYPTLSELGLGYGPSFQGLSRAWRDGDGSVWAEVALPEAAGRGEGYGLHPALLDAALHRLFLVSDSDETVRLPFALTEVTLQATGARALRVRLSGGGAHPASLTAWDAAGTPVLQIRSLDLRPATAQDLARGPDTARHLYRVAWEVVPAEPASLAGAWAVLGDLDGALVAALRHAGVPVQAFASWEDLLSVSSPVAGVLVDWGAPAATEVASPAHALAAAGLAQLQSWLQRPTLAQAALVWLTRGAVATRDGEPVPAPAARALWGLARATRAEHPDRTLRLLDVGEDAAATLLPALGCLAEPELALRGGQLLAPRLRPAGVAPETARIAVAPAGTAVVTGGTSGLGARAAAHLVARHGVKHLLLLSRQGPDAPGVAGLVASLQEAGAETVEVVAADAGERAALEAAFARLPAERPVSVVVHAAGVLADGVVTALTEDQLHRVLRPKVDGAVHLAALLAARPDVPLVLYSSAAGTLGNAGQANYAAANATLDALAEARSAQGLPTLSLAWGLWEEGGLVAHLTGADHARLRRQGARPLPVAEGLALLDAALARGGAGFVLLHLERRALGDEAPPLLQGLAPRGLRVAGTTPAPGGLAGELAALPEAERRARLLALVGQEVALVLGLPGPAAVAADRPLRELGLDSLMAVELRNRLGARAQLTLPATLAFDHPTPQAIATLLLWQALPEGAPRLPVVAATQHDPDAPIAIVGMACRTPGGVVDPEGYWALLSEGRDAIGPFPSRWDTAALYDPDPDAVGKSVAREGGFLDDLAGFEPGFFGISPREALAMDPGQRLMLEVAWEALERAGIAPGALGESATGVYLGSMGSDYGRGSDELELLDGYRGTGTASSVLAGRVAYTLGLQGPAMTVDTACSSSLVALHLAAGALRQGECDRALAGGVTVMCTPALFVEFSRLRGLSPDGRCKSFSAEADGAGWSEGVGLLVLKRLSDARRDGDRVLGVLRGSAVNQDGRSQGLTAPNGPSQQRAIRRALEQSGLLPDDLDAVEAHGTGTKLGDPIEAGALSAVFGPMRPPDRPLWLGSSKSNLGHTQAAAGVLGVMKVVLALQHEVLPATLHARNPSPHVDWERSGLQLAQEARPWPRRAGRPRRAGVSSFGVSGTNAHVIVEEAPDVPLGLEEEVGRSTVPVVVSGRTEAGLRAQARAWAAWLSTHPETPLGSVARTAALRRSAWRHRAVVVARDAAEAAAGLQALAEGAAHPAVVTGAAASEGRRVFVFPGQGGQWAGMGRALLAESPAFAAAVDACDAALRPHTGWSVQAVLAGEEGAPSLERVDVVQPALWAMSVGLASVWRSVGVEPELVVGHSQGEIAAAVVAGMLSLEDGARVVALRSRLVRRLSGQGAMASLELPLAGVEARLSGRGADLSVAVVNGPGSTVVAGLPEAVDALLTELAAEGVGSRRIAVDYASHSPQVDALLPELSELLKGIRPRAGQVPMVSTVTGARVEGEALDAAWWCRNLREPVRFDRALLALVAEGARSFVELSPHPVLTVPVTAAVDGVGGVAVGSLRRDEGGLGRLLRSLGEAVVAGAWPDWSALLGTGPWADLPTTAFVRGYHWLDEARRVASARDLGLEDADHPLLSAVAATPEGALQLFGRLSLRDTPWLTDHRVFGRAVLPGTALLELALAAARRCWPEATAPTVSELVLAAPVVLPETGARSVQVVVEAEDGEGRRSVRVASRPAEDEGGDWTEHASGTIAAQGEEVAPRLPSWPPVGATALDGSDLYPTLSELGLGYGPSFQGLSRAWRDGDGSVWAEVALPEAAGRGEGYGLHPALLDAALHRLFLVSDSDETVRLPFALADVTLQATGARALRVRLSGGGAHPASLTAWDAAGAPVLRIGALDLRPATAQDLARGPDTARHLYRVAWEVVPAEPASLAGAWAVLGDLDGALVAALRHAGVPVQAFASWEDLLSVSSPVAGVLVDWGAPAATEVASPAHALAAAGLAQLQSWLQRPTLAQAALVWLTRGAVATRDGEPVPAPAARALWGLARATRAEHPDRTLRLLDVGEDAAATLLPALGCLAEPELALRAGQLLAPRLRPAGPAALALPASGPWHLAVARAGSFDGLAIQARPAAAAPLGPGEVRLSVRAAGLNFRDVLAALGQYPGEPGPMGHEAAGVVLEVGSQVQALRPGDRVFGLVPAAFGPLAVADARLLAPIPGTLSFVEAAALPVALLTAWFGLFDLGGLRAGQRVLIHAAAGGVGQAALQLARLAGAEVYGTASPGKWPVLRALGLDETHLATSRDASFAPRILAATGGAGVDVVLDSLTGPLVDASLGLLVGGGRFIEMGKADIRDAAEVARAHPGVVYRAFDLVEAGPERLGALLRQVAELIEEGKLSPLPVVAHDLRQAPAVFRALAQGRTVGKRVLVPPRAPAAGTAVVTGGTSGLGARAAAHLVARHGVKHLLLLSRQGPDAPGVAGLVASLQEAGAETVEVVAADAGERAALEAAFARLPAERPVSVVVHAAGGLADGVVTALTEDQLHRVLRPKVDGAVHLAALLAARPDVPLVLYSSAAGTLGNAGQANYAAANATLDALAEARSAQGLPTLSLAWGLWEEGGLVAHLTGADHARLRRQGARPLPVAEGLALLDAALARGGAGFVLLHLERRALGDEAPPLLQGLAPRGLRVAGTTPAPGGLAGELAALPEAERRARLLALVGQEVALVLGLPGPAAVAADRPLRELGLDSLMAVELRNRLGARAQLTLPATLVFDHPSPHSLAEALLGQLIEGAPLEKEVDLRPLPARRPFATAASPGQRRLAFLHGVLPRPEVYNVHVPLLVEAALDPDALERAMEALIARHEQLRVGVEARDGEVGQRVLPWVDIPLEIYDLRSLPRAERERRLEELSRAQAARPFTLARPPLLRWGLVQLEANQSALLLTWHHAVTDGWSVSLLLRELSERYEAVRAGREPEAEPTASYARYSEHRQRLREGDALSPHRAWWRAALSGIEPLDLPTDRPPPPSPSHRGGTFSFVLPPELGGAIDGLARQEGVTPFVVLLGAFATLLYRLSGQSTFAVTTVSAGRPRAELEEVIGFFVNTLPLPCDLSGDPTVRELLGRLRARVEGALHHEELSLDEILRESDHHARGATRHPLASVSFVLEAEQWMSDAFASAPARGLGRSVSGDVEGTAKFDLSLALVRVKGAYQASLEYACDLFEEETVARWAASFEVLLRTWVTETERRLSDLPVLTKQERQRLLVDWNATAVPVPEVPVHALFEAQVRRTPDALAVVFGDEALTYAQLNTWANQLAWRLRALGVGPEARVAIALKRGLAMVAAMLGVLKAGGAYVPLDPSYPAERLRLMAEDAGLSVLVSTSDLALPTPRGVARLELDALDPSTEPDHDPPWSGAPDTLAYVIYTSGSTGRPKGVGVTHRGLPNLAQERRALQSIAPGQRVVQVASFSFDAFVSDLVGALSAGAILVLASEEERVSSERLGALLAQGGGTVLSPALLSTLSPSRVPGTLDLAVAGEALPASLAAVWASQHTLRNLYGPTETTVWSTAFRVDPGAHQAPAIGRPIANTHLYVLDAQSELTPVGAPGELYIGGLGLARGYLGRPGLTAERFVPDPFGPPGGRLYRTGDRCRWRPDGNLEFLGRLDHQVKVRGFRIELGEVEVALLAVPGVSQAVVVAREDGPGGVQLVAYVVGEDVPTAEALRTSLQQRLPAWMVPSAFVTLPALPLSPSGKVDRRSLPAPERKPSTPSGAPRTPVETALAAIWGEVLHLEKVGVHEDFFALGGDSILSVQVVSRAAKAGLALTVRDLFAHPTIAALASFLETGLTEGTSGPRCLVRLRAGDGERPLVCLAPLGGALFAFQHLAWSLRPGLPVFVLEAPEVAGLASSADTVSELVERYVAELLPLLSALGPVRLLGYSAGGVFAVELAAQLRERGVAVERLILVDSGAPGRAVAQGDEARQELGFLARHLGLDPAALAPLDLEGRIRLLADTFRARHEQRPDVTWEEHLHRIATAARRNRARLRGWTGRHPGLPATLIVAEESGRDQPDLGWGEVLGSDLEVLTIEGDHYDITQPPRVHTLARLVESSLGPAAAPSPSLPGRQRHYKSELTDTARWDRFRPRPGDVFVATMPKHGTTWTQTLCVMLLHGGPALPAPLAELSPWFDSMEEPLEDLIARLEIQEGRRVLKTHTPLDGIPYYPQCTYIAVYRDPRDAFFSRAEHALNLKEAERANMRRLQEPDADFQEWVSAPWPVGLQGAFCLEETLHHLRGFAALRHLPNVHLLHYADLRHDPAGALDRLAGILGVRLTPELRAAIRGATALDAMRAAAARFAPGAADPWHDVERFFSQGRLGGWQGKLSPASLDLFQRRLDEALPPALAAWLLDGGELPTPQP